MKERTPRKRLPKSETITIARDKSGEVIVRCRFCDAEMPLQRMWVHTCPRSATGNRLEEP